MFLILAFAVSQFAFAQEKLSLDEESGSENEDQAYRAIYLSYIVGPAATVKQKFTVLTLGSPNTFFYSNQYDFDNALKIGLEWSQFRRNSWNHGVLIDYAKLKLRSGKKPPVACAASCSSLPPDVQVDMNVLALGYSGKYRFNEFYIPRSK